MLLARIVRPQGHRGEALCDLHTDFPERFADRRDLWLRQGESEPRPVQLESHWLPTGNSAGRVVLKFMGIESIEAVEALAGTEVLVPHSERVALGHQNEFYISDLQGCVLVNVAGGDGPNDLGTITDVHFATDRNGKKLANAAPILVVAKPNGDEILVPLANEFLRNPDLANRRIEMALPNGLVEANG